MIYNIISQSSTSPFLKKSKIQLPGQQTTAGTLNTDTLLIDISDGSKDNSSNNTPNFASPKSANAQSGNDQTFKINEDDLDVIAVKHYRRAPATGGGTGSGSGTGNKVNQVCF